MKINILEPNEKEKEKRIVNLDFIPETIEELLICLQSEWEREDGTTSEKK